MIKPLTNEQQEILNDYLNSGMNYSDYALEHNLKFYQVRYIYRKYLKLKEASNIKNVEIGKLDFNNSTKSNCYDDSLRIKINDVKIEVERNLDEVEIFKIIKGCIYATRSK